MTVGISFTNGREAVTVTDAQVSGAGRKSDSFDKAEVFSKDLYHGVVYGTGNGFRVQEVLRNLDSFGGAGLDDFVQEINRNHKETIAAMEDAALAEEVRQIHQKADIIEDIKGRTRFVKGEIEKLHRRYENRKEEYSYGTEFVVTAYDRNQEGIRLFGLRDLRVIPIASDHIEVGSGADGANVYFATRMQGLDPRRLVLPDLAFHALNSYSLSNVNQGVGGSPKIVTIDGDKPKVLDADVTLILTNLSGAYSAEFDPSRLSASQVRSYFAKILGGKKIPTKEICRATGLNDRTLRKIYIPYSSWQESANRRAYG